jgi:integrase
MTKILTQASIDAVKPGDKRLEISDGKLPALRLVVQPSGARSWALRYRFKGRNAKWTLGPYPAIGLADARIQAKVALAKVATGTDPAAEKRQARTEAKAKVVADNPPDLVETVAAQFVEMHAKRKTRRRSWMETERVIAHDVMPYWRSKRLSAITRADVHALIDKVIARDKPVLANRLLGTLKTLGRWALDRGVIERNPFADIRPPAPSTSRDRVLDDKEIAALLAVLDNETYPVRPLVRFLLMTGGRRSEIARMTWSELDLDGAKVWRLPAARSKNGREHVLPLPDDAIDILRDLRRFEGNPHVFTFGGTGPVANFKFMARLDKAMAAKLGGPVARWTLHDLRRTLATNLQRLGVRLEVTESVLGHVSGSRGGIVGVYQRHTFGPEMKAALEAWALIVGAIVDGASAKKLAKIREQALQFVTGLKGSPDERRAQIEKLLERIDAQVRDEVETNVVELEAWR